jgi:hypothetical protein
VVTDDGSTVRKREVEGSSRFLVDDEVWVFCVEHGGAECGDERDGGLGGALNGHRGGPCGPAVEEVERGSWALRDQKYRHRLMITSLVSTIASPVVQCPKHQHQPRALKPSHVSSARIRTRRSELNVAHLSPAAFGEAGYRPTALELRGENCENAEPSDRSLWVEKNIAEVRTNRI